MVFKHGWISALAGISFLLVFLVSCEEDLDTLGDGVIASEPFVTDKAEFDVFAFNRSTVTVQTNRLPLYQIGVYDDPVYGRREAITTTQISFQNFQGNPVFGNFPQDIEDLPEELRNLDDVLDTIPENETIKEVILYLPYQLVPSATNKDTDSDGIPDELESLEDRDNPDSDQDNDGLTDFEEQRSGTNPFDPDTDGDGELDGEDENTVFTSFANTFALDSILSRRFIHSDSQDQYVGEQFNLRVERSTFFLRDLDPGSNFEESQEYFSNTDISTFVEGEPLFNGTVTIDNKEIITFEEDDPDTEDDESLTVSTRLNPGIQVTLDPQFFQENILDKEGSQELLSQSNLSNFIRGLHFSITPNNGDLLLLLDLTQANITITYEFDDFVLNDEGDVTEGTIEKAEGQLVLNLLQVQNNIIFGNAVNTFIDDPLPSEIVAQLDGDQTNAGRLYLKGGSGTFSELYLFDRDESIANDILEDIRANNWVINEANLIFYVDREAIDLNGGTVEPPRLYLYNAANNTPLFNVATETQTSQDPLGLFLNYDGILERNSAGEGIRYSIRITEYLNDIIVRDSTNAPLRLALTSNIGIVTIQEAESIMGERVDLPLMNTLNPLGTILFGNNVPLEEEDKKLKLQILYTETD
ncbi:MAG: DUF4270 family protein [Bacteroidota bacterium]